MLQYLIILLDDTSVSFCHYENTKTERKLISLENLKKGILFAMKQNLMIQFVFPACELPEEYKSVIETIDNHKIMPQNANTENADVVIFDNVNENDFSLFSEKSVVLRLSKADFFTKTEKICSLIGKTARLNIVFTDIETFTEKDFELYKTKLEILKNAVKEISLKDKFPQFNLLTDRVLLDKMNNCNAGIENITLAPNGKFYICPAFYFENESDFVGDLQNGIEIKNKQLLKFEYAPICRKCDAFQCKRCVWLNRKTTKEVNTPSREQCVTAHLERNASRDLLLDLQEHSAFLDKSIKEIDYLDPFDVVEKF